MKFYLILLTVFLFYMSGTMAQVTPVDSTISGHITSNVVLNSSKKYLLSGFVYVDSLAKITIPAGTKIFGEKATKGALIIKRGGKIDARGTATNPIIFTSQQPAGARQPGDWGGVIILGSAINNQSVHVQIEGGVDAYYGGNNDEDSSGVMQYVRIEYPGIAFQPNSEINGLTLGSVGSKTVLDHIQVSFSGDDAFEFFGGTVNAKYLVAYKTVDDDFDTDFGYRGKIQFGISYKDPMVADQSRSESFESDNDGSGTMKTPRTQPIFSNITCVGPKENSSSAVNPQHYYGIHQRRATKQSIHNSVFLGFSSGCIYLDGSAVTNQTVLSGAAADSFKFMDNVIGMNGSPSVGTNVAAFNAFSWLKSAGFRNDTLISSAAALLTDAYHPINPDLSPSSGSVLLGKANFSDNNLSDAFWTVTTFAGAFGNDGNRWDLGWTNYNPNSTVWSSSIALATSIKLINSNNESRLVTFGRATGATDGIDASFGETALPPALSQDIDARFIISGGNGLALDLRAYNTTDDVNIYTLRVKSGELATGNLSLSWDGNDLGGGNFFISDSGSGLFPLTNMKSKDSLVFDSFGNSDLDFYIYVYNKFSPSLSVGNGWNMVSFPGNHPNSMDMDTLYRSNDATVTQVYGYSGGYTGTTTLTAGKGYWMKHSGQKVYSFNGTNQSGIVYPKILFTKPSYTTVSAGWNLLGVYEYEVLTAELITVPNGIITGSIFGYTPGSSYGTTQLLESGKGYWVNCTTSGVIYLPSAYTGTLLKENKPEYVSNPRLIVSDKNNNNFVLYASSSSNEEKIFELPPAPPAGAFDVRFSTNKFAANLKEVGNMIQMQGCEFPVTIKAEGIDVVIKDVANGNLFNRTIQDGSSIQVTNELLNKLFVHEINAKPIDYRLEQNYPNPFNPNTTIRFSIPEMTNVRITVYNVLGQKIQDLVTGVFEAGNHKIEWNANALSSGVYFYEINTDKFTSLKKMILMK